MTSVLDSRQLQAFVMLSRTGSFTQAANGLFLTPSAVSHTLKELEKRVGCRLLDRRRKKVVLTQAGEQLLQHAEKILQEMSEACAALEHLGKWGKDRLRIGTSAAFCQYILPPVLEEFYRTSPNSRVTVELADTLETVELVRANKIDLAITLEPKNEREIEFHPLFTDELIFVVSPLHPWAKARQPVQAQIAKQPYILYKRNSYTFRLIEDFFGQEEIVLNTVIELGNMEAIRTGGEVAVLPAAGDKKAETELGNCVLAGPAPDPGGRNVCGALPEGHERFPKSNPIVQSSKLKKTISLSAGSEYVDEVQSQRHGVFNPWHADGRAAEGTVAAQGVVPPESVKALSK